MKKFLTFLFVMGLILAIGYYVFPYIFGEEPPDDDPNNHGKKPRIESFTVNGATFKMVYVEGGTFTMGATAEQGGDAEEKEYPNHKVTLSSFWIGQTEVTVKLWNAVTGDNTYTKDNQPAICTHWEQCERFITKLNHLTGKKFRFLTEAEWEYAARGGRLSKGYGNMSKGFKYAGSNDVNQVANYRNGQLSHVASLDPNELGLYDMSGNVDEWCLDWVSDYTEEAQTNPTGPATMIENRPYHIFRGGNYRSGFASECRVTRRGFSYYNLYGGLRLAM